MWNKGITQPRLCERFVEIYCICLRKNKLNYFAITSIKSILYIRSYERELSTWPETRQNLLFRPDNENLTFVEEASLLENDS
jgi:hypothetical protein